MTIIAGIEHGGRVYIGADSAGGDGWEIGPRDDPKVFRNGQYVIGFTTSYRFGQLVRFARLPEAPRVSVYRFMCTAFVDAIRSTLKSGGMAIVKDGAEMGGTMLVGIHGKLFTVHGDHQIAHTSCGFDAVGCAREVALGSLASTRGAPVRRLRTALRVSERFSAPIRGPFRIISGGGG